MTAQDLSIFAVLLLIVILIGMLGHRWAAPDDSHSLSEPSLVATESRFWVAMRGLIAAAVIVIMAILTRRRL